MITISTAEAVFTIVGSSLTAVIWALKKQADKTKREERIDANFKSMAEKNQQQDEHMESIDERFVGLGGKVDQVLEEIGNLKVTKEQVAQLQRENNERQRENQILMQKVDKMFGMMGRIETKLATLGR